MLHNHLYRGTFPDGYLSQHKSSWSTSGNKQIIGRGILLFHKENNVELNTTDDILTIKCEKKEEQEENDEQHFFVERYTGTFERRIKLPTLVKTNAIDAKFDRGVLTISLPKSEEEKKKAIKIKVH